jgi:hypothetical protein
LVVTPDGGVSRSLRWKKLLSLAVGLIVLTLCAGLATWLPPSDPMRKDFDRIHAGMTLAQVEAILGPPGNYRTPSDRGGEYLYPIVMWGDYSDSKGNKFCYWQYDSLQIEVVLGPDGRVLMAEYAHVTRGDDGIWENARRRLRQFLQWFSK